MVRPHFGGFTIPIINFLSDDLTRDRLEHRPCRLFRLNPAIRFEGKIHEQIATSIESLGLPIAQLDGIHIDHFGYQKSEIERKGKAQRTFSMLESELAQSPNDVFHLFNLGNAYFTAGRFEEAAETFSRADVIESAPYAQFMMYLWAFALHQIACHDDALAVCDRADESGIGGILIDYARSCILAEQGRLEEALAAVRAAHGKKLASDEPGDRAIEQYRAKALESSILLELHRLDEAIVAAKQAFTSSPTHRDLWIGWLRAAEIAGDGNELSEAFSAGADRFEFDAELCVAAGRAFESVGRNQNALECYQQAIETQPDHANAYFCAADLLLRQGFALEAAEAYQKGLGFEPYSAEGWFMLGNAMYRAGSYDGAALAYRQALQIDANHDRAAINLATIMEEESERAA
jgi:tetratricopeptide (TPR) repeat protein